MVNPFDFMFDKHKDRNNFLREGKKWEKINMSQGIHFSSFFSFINYEFLDWFSTILIQILK